MFDKFDADIHIEKFGSGKPTPDAIANRMSNGIAMRPNGSDASAFEPGSPMLIQSNRTKSASDNILLPAIRSVISDINSTVGDIKNIEISVTLTTKTGNGTAINQIKKNILAVYPTANVNIKYDPNFSANVRSDQKPSSEDFGFKVEGKGYKK